MKTKFYFLFFLTFFIISCNNSQKKLANKVPMEHLIDPSNDNQWVSLINPDSMEGWHYYQDNGQKSGWGIENGVLTFTSANAKGKGDKSLVSDKEYTSFKIHLEWKVSPGSNSGFFWV